jgi:DNA-binding phage protein
MFRSRCHGFCPSVTHRPARCLRRNAQVAREIGIRRQRLYKLRERG